MKKIFVIGIGAGNPDFLTVQAIDAMRATDVFFMPDKGEEKSGLNRIRASFLEHFAPEGKYRLIDFDIPERRRAGTPEYRESIGEWRAKLEASYRNLFASELTDGQTGSFLVWGDPGIYDGTLTILNDMAAADSEIEVVVIAGISAVQALSAAHRVALNGVGEPITITTGRRVLAGEADALPRFCVMLDNDMAFRRFVGQRMRIYWGAYLGTADEILVAGQLDSVAEEITQLRGEAQRRHGWIMDTYLLVREA